METHYSNTGIRNIERLEYVKVSEHCTCFSEVLFVLNVEYKLNTMDNQLKHFRPAHFNVMCLDFFR